MNRGQQAAGGAIDKKMRASCSKRAGGAKLRLLQHPRWMGKIVRVGKLRCVKTPKFRHQPGGQPSSCHVSGHMKPQPLSGERGQQLLRKGLPLWFAPIQRGLPSTSGCKGS